ncbi:TPA: hypothetical protein DCX15_06240 [bacterium]|nr:hypothetical protein [bacterium]
MKESILLIIIISTLLVSSALGSSSLPIIESEDDLYDLLSIGEISYSEYLDLLSLLRKGVEINTDEIMELAKIPGVSKIELLKIERFKREKGPFPFRQPEDLRNVPGLDEETYLRLLPFIRVSLRSPQTFKGRMKLGIREVLDNKESAEACGQLKFFYDKHTQAYISMKKAKGEDEFKTKYRYLKLEDLGPLKETTFGNYRAYFGERLVIGHRFDGVMTHLRLGRFEPSFLYSHSTGAEKVMGVNLGLLLGAKGKIGANYLACGGNPQGVYGIHLNLPIEDIEIFSEWAKVLGRGVGLIAGANLNRKPIRLLASYRSYDQDFSNPYSGGFGSNQDEQGVYLELKYRISPKCQVMGSFNQWRHPSSLITDSESAAALYCNLSKKTRLRLLRTWKDEDIERDKGRKTKTSLEMALSPLAKTKIFLCLRGNEKDLTTSSDRELDIYGRLKLRYNISDSLEIETAIRYSDINIYKIGQSRLAYYLQWKDQLNDYLLFLLRYTNTTYSPEHSPPNPEHKFGFQLEIAW